jgi:hypothetical protein
MWKLASIHVGLCKCKWNECSFYKMLVASLMKCKYFKSISYNSLSWIEFEPSQDKTNIVDLRPAWIQTSLHIHAVWSGSMLFAYQLYYKWRNWQRTAWILIRLGGCAGWSWSMLVTNPLCHDLAHLYIIL